MREYLKSKYLKWRYTIIFLFIILFLSVIMTSAIGPVYVSPIEIIRVLLGGTSQIHKTIILQIRVPRVILAMLVGIALSIAGAAMQGFFKNPMADPYIIGISSGAALGAVVAIILGIFGIFGKQILSFIGAISATFLVYTIAKTGGKIRVDTLLLSGIAISCFLSAIIALLISVSTESLHQAWFWIMGGFWFADWSKVRLSFPFILVGSSLIYFFARDLNAMLLGEESAQYLGIKVESVKKMLLTLSAFVTASAVSVSGTIGFVGLIIPHITRILVGPDHRILFPASALVGGSFLVWADAITRIWAFELPVGIITALAGAPFFIYLLRRRKSGLI